MRSKNGNYTTEYTEHYVDEIGDTIIADKLKVSTRHLEPVYRSDKDKKITSGEVALGIHWKAAVANALAESVLRYFQNIDVAEEVSKEQDASYDNPIEVLDTLTVTCHHIPSNEIDTDLMLQVINNTLKAHEVAWRARTVVRVKYRFKDERSVYTGVQISLSRVELTDLMESPSKKIRMHHTGGVTWSFGDAPWSKAVSHIYGKLPNYTVMSTTDIRYYFKHNVQGKQQLTKGQKASQRANAQRGKLSKRRR